MKFFFQFIFLTLIFHCTAQTTHYRTGDIFDFENDIIPTDSANIKGKINHKITSENIFDTVLQTKDSNKLKTNNEFAFLIPGYNKIKLNTNREFADSVSPKIGQAISSKEEKNNLKNDLLLKNKFVGFWTRSFYKDSSGKEIGSFSRISGQFSPELGMEFLENGNCRETVGAFICMMPHDIKIRFRVFDSLIIFTTKKLNGNLAYSTYKILFATGEKIRLLKLFESVIPPYSEETQKRDPEGKSIGQNKSFRVPDSKIIKYTSIPANGIPKSGSAAEKWDVLLQSFVDEEFIYCKKFDSAGKLTSYITSGKGFHCTFFPLSCIDFNRNDSGNIICKIHSVKQEHGEITWNCTGGNLVFGCDTIKTKTDNENQLAILSECFGQRRTSYKKEGDTICFKMNLVDGKKTKETWKVIKENEDEIILEKLKEKDAPLYCAPTACPKKLTSENNSPADIYYKTSLLLE